MDGGKENGASPKTLDVPIAIIWRLLAFIATLAVGALGGYGGSYPQYSTVIDRYNSLSDKVNMNDKEIARLHDARDECATHTDRLSERLLYLERYILKGGRGGD